jgi:hypothetical protein
MDILYNICQGMIIVSITSACLTLCGGIVITIIRLIKRL